MIEHYMARIMMNSKILLDLFKETIDATLQQLLISNAEVLNAVRDMIDHSG